MNTSPFARNRSLRMGSLVAVAALVFLTPALAAQDDAEESHPAHIHAGTCAQLGEVVYPLANVALPTGDHMGPESAHPVKSSEGNRVDASLQDIIDGGHAINVHLSDAEIGTYIACGDIGGPVHEEESREGMELTIALAELNDSGHTGIAWLGSDGDATLVSIDLIEPDTMSSAGADAAQEASPAADAAAEASAVEIKDFAFNPAEIAVPVGGSVTWTNQDNAPHTATGDDRAVLQSGAIAFGESFTQTFDTAGEYSYFCEFHPNMNGTVVVE